jgi:hypothetical protein
VSDNITLPREVVEAVLRIVERNRDWSEVRQSGDYAAILRAARAAEQPKQEHFAVLAIACKDKEIDRLTDENEALRLNDARYRYLRNRDPKEVFNKSGKAAGVWIDWEDDMAGLQLLTGDDADAAIDAAMEPATEPAIGATGES